VSSIFRFENRASAGEQLAKAISKEIANLDVPPEEVLNCIVYALPRGGVPVAVPIARSLACPLDAIAAKKITPPGNPELAIGAVTSDGCVLWSDNKPGNAVVESTLVDEACKKAREQLDAISPGVPGISPAGRFVILVDDGIATGMTMAAAARAVKSQKPTRLWICVPVGPPESLPFLQEYCDRLIVLQTPQPFLSVSRFYQEFPQVETEEAKAYLQEQRHINEH
jgi:predicted phosphoribosyltransferase